MFRITVTRNANATALRLEGRLTGPWVDELERAWRDVAADPATARTCVDITDVTLVSEDGKRLLESMCAQGARLKGSSCATRHLVDEIEHTFSRAHAKQGAVQSE